MASIPDVSLTPAWGSLPNEDRSAGEKCLAAICFALRLYCGIGIEQPRHIQHRGVEDLADEIARLVDGDMVRRGSMTIHDEDPLEAILRDLPADIRDQ